MANALPPPEDLIRFLCDDSPATVAAVRGTLRKMGLEAADALEDAVASDDAKLRARARQLLAEIQRERGLGRLRTLMAPGIAEPYSLDLPLGDLPSGQDGPPEGKVEIVDGLLAIDSMLGMAEDEEVLEQLDDWSDALSVSLPPRPSTLQVAHALGNTLGSEARLQGPEYDYHNIENVSISRAVRTRHGLPLTLSAIYAATARLAGFRAALLPFPGHVLLALGPKEDRTIMDPFAGGMIMTKESCVMRLGAMGAPRSQRWLTPASDRAMLIRQMHNTESALRRHRRDRDARILRSLLNEADPSR